MMNPHFDDDEHNTVNAADKQATIKRSTWASVGVNIVISSVQIAAGILTKSQGLIADGIHSLSDLIADFVVLFASHHSQKDADTDHPYGHHRFETGASFALGLILLAAGIGMVISAALKLQQPAEIATVHVAALWVAVGTLISKELLFRYMLRAAKAVKSSMLVANAWHARADAASSLVVAAGIAANLLGYPIFDPIAAILVGFMIGKMGWTFAFAALHDLMDRAADDVEVAAIRTTILQTPGVIDVHDLRTRRMGEMIVADAHIVVAPDITVTAGHDIAVAARSNVMARHRVLNLMTHVDPAEK